jgi:hypothetical protein
MISAYVNFCLASKIITAAKIDKLIYHYPDLKSEIMSLNEADPSSSKKYLNWGVNQLVAGADVNDVIDIIKKFDKVSGKISNPDINQWEIGGLKKELEILNSKFTKSQNKMSGAKKLYEDEQCSVYQINDREGARLYGSGTKWCITTKKDEENMFNTYGGFNTVFFFILRKDLDNSDPLYKVAVAVIRDDKNQVVDMEWYNAVDDKFTHPILDGLDKANYIIKLIKDVSVKLPTNLEIRVKDNNTDVDSLSGQEKIRGIEVLFRSYLIGRIKSISPKLMEFWYLSGKTNYDYINIIAKSDVASSILIDIMKRITSETIDDDMSNEIAESLLNNKNLPSLSIKIVESAVLEGRANLAIKQYLANYDNTSTKVLLALCDDELESIKYSVASRTNLPLPVMYKLSKDVDPEIRYTICLNDNIPLEILQDISKGNDFAADKAKELLTK